MPAVPVTSTLNERASFTVRVKVVVAGSPFAGAGLSPVRRTNTWISMASPRSRSVASGTRRASASSKSRSYVSRRLVGL